MNKVMLAKLCGRKLTDEEIAVVEMVNSLDVNPGLILMKLTIEAKSQGYAEGLKAANEMARDLRKMKVNS
ncbi:hypothetical protein M3223_08660 [Paenibacillus pasadenensis]|uniref:hypothetical protein n=1 Tax=Paenibacillus pasadenensis TaxID=217090 RepID=UPI00203EEBA2|nr:hypothetical protein [Paenibacillus pasadenensis]MCM3747424.1 hypothetical protein [Paenibacillus pasadenensis]